MLLFFPQIKKNFSWGNYFAYCQLMDLDLGLRVEIAPGAPPPAFHLGEVEVKFLSKAKLAFICNLELNYSFKMSIYTFQIISIPLDTNCSTHLK